MGDTGQGPKRLRAAPRALRNDVTYLSHFDGRLAAEIDAAHVLCHAGRRVQTSPKTDRPDGLGPRLVAARATRAHARVWCHTHRRCGGIQFCRLWGPLHTAAGGAQCGRARARHAHMRAYGATLTAAVGGSNFADFGAPCTQRPAGHNAGAHARDTRATRAHARV